MKTIYELLLKKNIDRSDLSTYDIDKIIVFEIYLIRFLNTLEKVKKEKNG